jgi:acylpyruvate hydrolase
MRLVSYETAGGYHAGIVRGERIVPSAATSIRALLETGASLDDAPEAAGDVALDDANLGPPVPDPDKIICIGLNYRSHAAEAGIEPPAVPTLFAKFRNALVGMVRPSRSRAPARRSTTRPRLRS